MAKSEESTSYEFEPTIKKHIHTDSSENKMRATQSFIFEENLKDLSPSEFPFASKQFEANSPAATLALSLLQQKLEVLSKLHKLKMLQLRRLFENQNKSREVRVYQEVSQEFIQEKSEEDSLLEMLHQISEGCTAKIVMTTPFLENQAQGNKDKYEGDTGKVESTEPSRECSTSQKSASNLNDHGNVPLIDMATTFTEEINYREDSAISPVIGLDRIALPELCAEKSFFGDDIETSNSHPQTQNIFSLSYLGEFENIDQRNELSYFNGDQPY